MVFPATGSEVGFPTNILHNLNSCKTKYPPLYFLLNSLISFKSSNLGETIHLIICTAKEKNDQKEGFCQTPTPLETLTQLELRSSFYKNKVYKNAKPQIK